MHRMIWLKTKLTSFLVQASISEALCHFWVVVKQKQKKNILNIWKQNSVKPHFYCASLSLQKFIKKKIKNKKSLHLHVETKRLLEFSHSDSVEVVL